MSRYVEKILAPYMRAQRDEPGVSDDVPGHLVMDVYRAHRTPDVLEVIEQAGCKLRFVPANCTSEMQPLDVTINKVVKDELKRHLIDWYAKEVFESLENEQSAKEVKLDFKMSNIKPVHARWMIDIMANVSQRKELILAGWRKSLAVKPCASVPTQDKCAVQNEKEDDDKVTVTVPRNTAIIVKEEEDEKPRDPTCKTALENEIVSTITLFHEVWQETRFHEWYLPKEFSQGQLNGNRGSTACTVIAAEMCSDFAGSGRCQLPLQCINPTKNGGTEQLCASNEER